MNYKRLKRKTHKITTDKLIACVNSGDHFGIYWEQNTFFHPQEIRNYFTDRSFSEKNIYNYLIEHAFQLSGKNRYKIKYIGEKTPLNIFHVGRLFKWFPESTFLFIHRNPIDVLRSEVNKKEKPAYFFGKNNPLYPYGLAIFVFFEWLLTAVIALYNNAVHKKKIFIISYENLFLYQESSLRAICSALNIEYKREFCEKKKIGSSYSAGNIIEYWYPSKLIVFLYALALTPLRVLLNRVSLNKRNVYAKY